MRGFILFGPLYAEPCRACSIPARQFSCRPTDADAAVTAPDPAARSRAVTPDRSDPDSFAPRELLLAAAARAVLAAFREPLEQKRLAAPATATLRLLETALEPYRPRSAARFVSGYANKPLPPPQAPDTLAHPWGEADMTKALRTGQFKADEARRIAALGGGRPGLPDRPGRRKEDFLENYYEQKPLINIRNEPDRYADLLTLDIVDHFINSADLREGLVDLTNHRNRIERDDYIDEDGRVSRRGRRRGISERRDDHPAAAARIRSSTSASSAGRWRRCSPATCRPTST